MNNFNRLYSKIVMQSSGLSYQYFQKHTWDLIQVMFQKHGKQIMDHIIEDINQRGIGTITWGQLADIIQYNTIGDPPLVDGKQDYTVWLDDEELGQKLRSTLQDQPDDYQGWANNDLQEQAAQMVTLLPYDVVGTLTDNNIQVY